MIGLLVVLRGRLRRMLHHARQGTFAGRRRQPFQRLRADATRHVLFVGDSTAVGTGAERAEESVAGYFGQEHPQDYVENLGVNGLRVGGLLNTLSLARQSHYDLAVVMIGGNDVLHDTPPDPLERQFVQSLRRLKELAPRVVFVCEGNLGNAPLLPTWIGRILDRRSRKLRDRCLRLARNEGVMAVDMFVEREDDTWRLDPDQFYSADWFHPGSRGYRMWYEALRQTLADHGAAP